MKTDGHKKKIYYLALWWIVWGIVCITSGCSGVKVRVPVTVVPQSNVHVAFDSFVSVNYGKKRSLYGLQTTQMAIEKTLQLWYNQVQVRQTVVDGTPQDLKKFLQTLPCDQECDISVVYLGSIQNPAGGLEFVNSDVAYWPDLLNAISLPSHPHRIVILDACFAATVRSIPAWTKCFGTTLLASGMDEKTYQFMPSALLPIDVQKYSPQAWSWAQTYLPEQWSKYISFLGLMWIQTTAQTPTPLANEADWAQFFGACGQNAAIFRSKVSQRWGSTVQSFSSLSKNPTDR